MSYPQAPPDRRRAGDIRWVEQRLFDIPEFVREKAAMSERLAVFRASLLDLNGGKPTRHTEKTVDIFRQFLDTLRGR
jgi:hypothetical protein